MIELALLVGAYLVGSISFGYLVVRLLRGKDIRELGSRNAGATNALRVAGPVAALAVLALDVAKGAVPVLVATRVDAAPPVVGAVGFAAVIGHVFPIYLRFRGGKGVATTLGALAGLALWPTAAAVVAVLLLISWTRYVSLGSIVGVSLAPLLLQLWGAGGWSVGAAMAMAVLVVARHSSNIRRLRAGTERRLGERVEIAG